MSAPQYQAELAEDQILQIQAERAADQILFQLQRQKATEPQRKQAAAAQLEHDKVRFAEICRRNSISECEANFNLWRSTKSISGLAPASQSEQDRYSQEAVEQRNEFLLNADTETLRTLAREEGAANRQAALQTEADSQLAAAQERDSRFGFPRLPDTWQGQKLDATFVKNCSVEIQKLLQKRFGSAQLTARLQGRG